MVKTYVRPCIVVLSFILFAFVVNAVSVFAAISYGSEGYYSVYGYNYFNQASISVDSTLARASISVGTSNGVLAPSGYMGYKARLFDAGTGAMVDESSWKYSSSACISMFGGYADKSNPSKGKSYYSYGITAGYNGNGYSTYYTFKSPSQTVQ